MEVFQNVRVKSVKQCFEVRRVIRLCFLFLILWMISLLFGCASIESSTPSSEALATVVTTTLSPSTVIDSISKESSVETSETETIFEESKFSETIIANVGCGKYIGAYSDGYSFYSIYPAYENSYYMDIHITRLTSIVRCEIAYVDGFIRVAGKDASSNPIYFSFEEQEGSFVLSVEDSTWHYLSNGQSFSGIKN